ncbi:vWA domain-containing protein [Micromonospora humida]|uniref:vWA domain-containing protein n=1 Tax=Micromonospora humida TaxID=2809018 RepID=UPI0033DCEC42
MSSPTDPPVPATGEPTAVDPTVAVAALAGHRRPYLIGVRHHSPALAVALPRLLAGYRPEVLLLELPPELGRWLPWLADPATVAPVALAGVLGDGGGPAFYPFADFSPELAAVRWAARNGVPVVPCDLPLADPVWREREPGAAPTPGRSFADALRAAGSGRADEDLWDRTVEARAPGADPEAVRRAALAVGWALRADAERGAGVSALDLRREARMRQCLAGAGQRRVAALVGAFHAPALLVGEEAPALLTGAEAPALLTGREAPPPAGPATVVTSLVPYTFGLLDARSGYPAGIRDPQWQQSVLTADGDPVAVESATTDAVVAVCAAIRRAGHPAGPGEARETVRLALDLARLRGLPAPGRGELVEAIQSVLAHGEVLGRGRAVAHAMEHVLVGDRRGVLAPGTPRSGLAPAVRELLAGLRLPGAGDPARELRLDPLRSALDRRREVTLHRLQVCDVAYAEQVGGAGVGGVDPVTTRWRVQWSPRTEATIEVAGLRGVTLGQAAEGALVERRRRERAEDGPTVAAVITGLADAARCDLTALAARRLAEVAVTVPAEGTLGELVTALALLDRLRLGHLPGGADLPPDELARVAEALESAAVRQVDGLAGAQDVADAEALATLAQRADAAGAGLRLADCLARLAARGTPLMAAAAGAVRVLLGLREPAAFGRLVASWVDTASTPAGRQQLQGHLTGLLVVAEPLLRANGEVFDGLLERVETLPDEEFLTRLPALRAGFHVVSPAGRDRLLDVVRGRLDDGGPDADVAVLDDPDALLVRLRADAAGRRALLAQGLLAAEPPEPPTAADATRPATRRAPAGGLSTVDRWRLVLGRESTRVGSRARRYATALDELYGAGRGEGAAAEAAGRAGREASFPGVREWAQELSALFGPGVREEVLARAVEAGRLDAVTELDPAAVRPSVELLRDVLTLAGGLPESTVARLRPLVARIVAELTRRLAARLRPALTGLTTPRPTYRPGGPLDLPRTLRANLATARRDAQGRMLLVPDRPVFRTRARRGVDWRLVLVVDVSGSMEESVIWSALTAAVLAGVPALSTHFVAFSTEVVDLTERVDDPLALLLEVSVGGGTHIAAGLRYARSLVTVPQRTMVVVISDFEEGYPMGGLLAETRALVEAGCQVLGCASLDDTGRPRYSVAAAGQLVAAGMPVAALSPLELARWVGEQVRR